MCTSIYLHVKKGTFLEIELEERKYLFETLVPLQESYVRTAGQKRDEKIWISWKYFLVNRVLSIFPFCILDIMKPDI